MTDDNKSSGKKIVTSTLNRKFGVSEARIPKKFTPKKRFDESRNFGDRKKFDDSRNFGDRKRFDEPRSFGERKKFDDSRSFGDRKRFDESRNFGDRKRFDDSKSFGDRKRFDDSKSFGDRKRFDDSRSFGERKKFDESRNFGERKKFDDSRNFGDRKRFDASRNFGDRKKFDDSRSFGERKKFDDSKSFGDRKKFDASRNFGEKKKFDEDRSELYRIKRSTEDPIELEIASHPETNEEVSEKPATPAWFKRLLSLNTEKGREKESKFLAEGQNVVQEIITHHLDLIEKIYVVKDFKDSVFLNQIQKLGIANEELSVDLMKQAATTVTSQGVIAVCRMASLKPDYDKGRSVLTLVDAIQDPGNLGALYGTSLGFNSSGLILGKGTVSPFNSKVVRGSSGTFLRVPFESDIELSEHIQFLRQKGYVIIATDLHAKQTLSDLSPRKLKKVAFLMGNEGAGAKSYLIELADESVRIPMNHSLESLNVAVAHGILSYEIMQLQKDLQ